jgi:hypothetical protein
MKDLKYTPSNFLKYNLKKGLETQKTGLVVSIRNSTFINVTKRELPLIVTAEGEDNIMILTPEDLKVGIIGISPVLKGRDGKNYTLLFYHWKPMDRKYLSLLDELYCKVNSIKKIIDGTQD